MKLNNVKSVKCLSFTLNVDYVKRNLCIGPEPLARVSEVDNKIEMVEDVKGDLYSHTLWHEIIHHIDFKLHIKDNGEELSDNEIDRLATALNSLEIEYIKKPKETDYSFLVGENLKKEMYDKFGIMDECIGAKWFRLKDVPPADNSRCIVIDFKYGVTQAIWEKSQQRFILDTGEHVNNPAILWAPFNQELWEKLLQVNNA